MTHLSRLDDIQKLRHMHDYLASVCRVLSKSDEGTCVFRIAHRLHHEIQDFLLEDQGAVNAKDKCKQSYFMLAKLIRYKTWAGFWNISLSF